MEVEFGEGNGKGWKGRGDAVAMEVYCIGGRRKMGEGVEIVIGGVEGVEVAFVVGVGRGNPDFGEFGELVARGVKRVEGLGQTERECVDAVVGDVKGVEGGGEGAFHCFNLAEFGREDLEAAGKDGDVGEVVA